MKHQHDQKEAEAELLNKAKEEMETFIEKIIRT